MRKEAHNIYSTLTEMLQDMTRYAESSPPDPDQAAIVLKHFKSTKDDLSLEQKGEVLKECMKFNNPTLAKEISKEMGCPITTKSGFTKVIPLVEWAESKFFARKAIDLNLFDQSIESEYGKVEGLILFDRLMRSYFFPAEDREPFVFSPWSERDRADFEKILNGRSVFDFLMQKDSNGNHIIKDSEYLKSTLWLVLPGEEKNDRHRWSQGLKTALTNACKNHSEKMRAAVEACLLDNQKAFNYLWGEETRNSGWAKHIDILYSEGIISSQEFQKLFCQFLQPSSGVKLHQTIASLGDRINFLSEFIKNNWEIIKNLEDFSEDIWKNFDMDKVNEMFNIFFRWRNFSGEQLNIKEKIMNNILNFPTQVETTVLQKTSAKPDSERKRNILKI